MPTVLPTWLIDKVNQADGLLICAGAGMGVDSGLPDFRGNEGFWKAYPALKNAGIGFIDAANPDTFATNPQRAWGFYGHRLNLYRSTRPHSGFHGLKQLGENKTHGYFVFTSNVDGQFQKAGFEPDRIVECHGSIHHLQCSHDCQGKIWPATEVQLNIDNDQCLATSELPTCPDCGKLARPNILMFGDYHWQPKRTEQQQNRFMQWLHQVERLLVIECGAGTSIPTVRHLSERVGGTLIRINPRESNLNGADGIGLDVAAKSGIEALLHQTLT